MLRARRYKRVTMAGSAILPPYVRNSAAPERRAPFASASSATVPALDFKGLVRTVAAVSGW
jgi:hypothetical protein